MTDFNIRAESMGLDITQAEKGLYTYSDRHCDLVYRTLKTEFDNNVEELHSTDDLRVPRIALFTRLPEAIHPGEEFEYVTSLSDKYQFVGNEVITQQIKDSVLATGLPIMDEHNYISPNLSRMRSEITIRSSRNHPRVGDVLPVVIVNNSYDGSKAASINFGLTFRHGMERLSFAFHLGNLKQIHISHANTNIESPIESYINTFSDNILTMINDSFNRTLTESEMLSTLDVIEHISKNRRKEIAEILKSMLPDVQEGQEPPLPTSWQIFLAIVRYSSFEKNLNAKDLLENAAQSALIIPVQMMNVLKSLNN